MPTALPSVCWRMFQLVNYKFSVYVCVCVWKFSLVCLLTWWWSACRRSQRLFQYQSNWRTWQAFTTTLWVWWPVLQHVLKSLNLWLSRQILEVGFNILFSVFTKFQWNFSTTTLPLKSKSKCVASRSECPDVMGLYSFQPGSNWSWCL